MALLHGHGSLPALPIMLARQAVLLTPSKSVHPAPLPSYKQIAPVGPLKPSFLFSHLRTPNLQASCFQIVANCRGCTPLPPLIKLVTLRPVYPLYSQAHGAHPRSKRFSPQPSTFKSSYIQRLRSGPPRFSVSCEAACGDSFPFHQSQVTIHESLSPLECAVLDKYRVLPGFGRNRPHVSPLECADPQNAPVSPLECADAKKVGGRRGCNG
jgi:hypothetical protein